MPVQLPYEAREAFQKLHRLIVIYCEVALNQKSPIPGVFQVVRAMGLCFSPHFEVAQGLYAFVGSIDSGKTSILYRPHAWLEFARDKKVLVDVLPLFQPNNQKLPTIVLTNGKPGHFGYYKTPVARPQNQVKVTREIEALVEQFETILRLPKF